MCSSQQHRLWQLEDPFLYRLKTRVASGPGQDAHENMMRFGFRELRVEDGYFHLNGRRIFLKSSHTGNHCPVGAIVRPVGAADLLRQDLVYMKASGFNTARFIAGMAHPYQLALCDELGLMVYEENLAAWLLADSPKMAERFSENARGILLVGRATSAMPQSAWARLLTRVARGSTVVFLDSAVFQKGKDPAGWLPLKIKGQLTRFSDWLYHKECVAGRHPLLAGLAAAGIMDWDYYGPLISNRFFEGQETPEQTAVAAFAVCHSSRPDGYAAGVMLGIYSFEAGKIILNTLNIMENLNNHPAADRLLLNLIGYAGRSATGPAAPLPPHFDLVMKELGY